jgi:hypothetical protein
VCLRRVSSIHARHEYWPRMKTDVFQLSRRRAMSFEYSRSVGSNLINDGSSVLPLRVQAISAQASKIVGDSVNEVLLFSSFWYARIAVVVQAGDDTLELVDSDTTAEGTLDRLL